MIKRTEQQIYDELLIIKCQSGDHEAFAELVNRWNNRIRRHVWRLTDGHDDTADIVQEVWADVIRRLRRLNDPAAFPKWIYKIATARSVDWIRKQKRQRDLKLAFKDEPKTTNNNIELNNEIDLLRNAIKRLPVEHATILTLFYLDELSTLDIAEALSLPVGTVKSRLFNARNLLRELIERSR